MFLGEIRPNVSIHFKRTIAIREFEMSRILRNAIIAVVAIGMGVLSAPSADAALRLRIEKGTTTGPGVVITDEAASESGAAGSFAGTADAIAFAGSVGQFVLNVTTGTSTPFLVAPGYFEAMDLSNITINAGGAGVLRLILARTDYGAATPDGTLLFSNTVGGVLTASGGSSITFSTRMRTTRMRSQPLVLMLIPWVR